MSFLILLAIIAVLLLLQLPKIWIKQIYRDYNQPRPYILGSGEQFAKHLLSKHAMSDFKVIETGGSSHYNHRTRQICLAKDLFNNQSVTSLTIAAHEFAHAQQYKERMPLFFTRVLLGNLLGWVRIFMAIMFFGSLVAGFLFGNRAFLLLSGLSYIIPGILDLLFAIVSLPTEWDASFNRAYPLIIKGGYLPKTDSFKIKKILAAALLTYVAGALSNLLSLFNFSPFFRRRA